MDNCQKVLNLLGLSARAGRIVSGEFSAEKAVREGRAQLVIVSDEASDNTKKLFYNKCSYYQVPVYCFGKKSELGHAIGREQRASVAVTDAGLAKAIVTQMNMIGGSEYERK